MENWLIHWNIRTNERKCGTDHIYCEKLNGKLITRPNYIKYLVGMDLDTVSLDHSEENGWTLNLKPM